MQVHDSLSGLVGNTPLVRLRSVTRGIPGANVLAKVEYFNPGGSVKDRIALRMVAAAEASGDLRPGGTIVEPTSAGSSCGTFASAAATIWAARLSGRMAVSEPLPARPMGDRAVATITASGMVCPPRIGFFQN